MNWIKQHWTNLLPPVILIVVIAIAGYSPWSNYASFWKDFFTILLPIIAGVPFALWVNDLIKLKEKRDNFNEDRKREKDILNFILQELNFNKDRIQEERNINNTGFQPLQTEMWEVLKSTGDLKLIQNTELLNYTTSAYDIILKVKHFEEKALDDYHYGNAPLANRNSVWSIQLDRARTFDTLLLESIDNALQKISNRVKELS